MGTRADFYIRNENVEPKMQWLGSIAWDGYEVDGVETATTEQEFREKLSAFFSKRDDVTLPEQGWPWPWNDSRTTDYSWIFENGKVMASIFGYPLFDPLVEQDDDEDDSNDEQKLVGYFPDMTDIKNVTFGKGSGIIVIGTN